VRTLNLLLAVMAAVTVTVAMRVVGLLLVSALMVVPVVAAQQLTRSFAATQAAAIALGVVVSLAGVTGSYHLNVPSGPAIVLLAIAVFAVFSVIAAPLARRRHRRRGEADRGPTVCDVAIPERIPGLIPGRGADRVPDGIPDQIPGQIPGKTSSDTGTPERRAGLAQ
jgi:zinc transport system permease protein